MRNYHRRLNCSVRKAIISLVILLFASLAMKAQIASVAAVVNPSAYSTGGSVEVTFQVWFGISNPEYADFIEFVAPQGISLLSNFHDNEEYFGCGKNHGDLFPANNGANGIGWGKPGFQLGGSGCGAFRDSTWHSFKLRIAADANINGPIAIEVNVYGDGFNLTSPSVASTSVALANTACILICPDDIEVNNDFNECGAFVNYSATVGGDCTSTPNNQSGFYPVGTTAVDFILNENTAQEIQCTRYVTVLDNESPYLNNCGDMFVDLNLGECSASIKFDLGIDENCGDIPVAMVQSKINDIDFSLACNLGQTHYFRVFDLQNYNVGNDLTLSSIDLGIFESYNGPSIELNIYALNGPLQFGNLTLINSTNAILPDLNKQLYNIPLITIIPGGTTIAVEIITPINNGSVGSIMGFNDAGELYPSYIMTPACGETQPVLVENAFGSTVSGSLVMNLNGTENAIKITANHASGLMPGDEFGMGVHDLSYTVSDASGNAITCEMTLSLQGAIGGSSVLACNDTIRVAMEETCEIEITPDMLLEGDHYACYEIYDVIVYDPQGNPIGNIITSDYVGMILEADVYFEEFDNRCSTYIVVEDNYPPVFTCDTVTTSCAGNLLPGSVIPNKIAYTIKPAIKQIPNDIIYQLDIDIPINGLTNALITDLDVIIDISHEAVSELSASLIAPDGTIISLFTKPGNAVGCVGNDLALRLDDNAVLTPTDLDNTCYAEAPVIKGIFKPLQSLAILNGTAVNGNWTLRIIDDNNTNGGTINYVTLAFQQTNGVFSLPIPQTANFVYEGSNIFSVYNFDACGTATLSFEDTAIDQDCDSPFSSIIKRDWIGTDQMGNTSTCTQIVQVLRNGASFLEFPPNYDDVEENAISCIPGDDFYPYPNLTGEPAGDLCGDVEMTYEDLRIDICPGTFKILRNWRVIDWCTGAVLEHTQVIKIKDEEGPVITSDLPDMTVYTDPHSCSTDVDLPDPFADPSMILYDCRKEEISYKVGYKFAQEDGTAPPPTVPWIYDEGIEIIEHPDGSFHYSLLDVFADSTWIKYTFTDPCGNSTDAYFEIFLYDQSPPVAVCDEHTQVSLGTNGLAYVSAFTFDDGSHDNCSEISYEARRMNPACDEVTTFADSVLFCCEDIGTTQMVELKVTDINGNYSVCMVEVVVVDKYPPIVICPDDIEINCNEDYNNLALTGEAEAFDNCSIDTIYYVDDENIDNCGNGYVLRVWYATDHVGLTSSCYQVITLRDENPFNEKDIIWPDDVTLFECESNTGPAITGDVIYNDDMCSLVAVTYKDQLFNIVEGTCLKILRTWSVVDWCTFDNNETFGSGYWEHTQVIKLMNTEGPVFTENCEDLEFCSYGQCEGYIEFVKEAHDDCTPDELLRWRHHIDLYNDGTFDSYGINSNDASGTYPDGTHRIAWVVEDGCGNITTCEQIFEVRDCKKPTPLCISQLATAVMNYTGMVEICAKDFDLCGNCVDGSYDNCTASGDLKFSFSDDVTDSCRILTCDDIPNGESAFIEFQMWVTDEAGNQDYCTVTLDLQDNEANFCKDSIYGAIVVSGLIQNSMGTAVEGVLMQLEDNWNSTGFPRFEYTDNNGSYAFENVDDNRDYRVTPDKNNNPGAGVSTLDLIYIQRHLLGLQALTDPFKIIAADADNNEKITASDLLTIRKLILGITDEFSNGQKSWRFVSDWQDFDNPLFPFPFIESINTNEFKELVELVNFTAVKIGDVNNSALDQFSNEGIEIRSSKNFGLLVDEQSFEPNQSITIDFYVEDLKNILGSQFTIDFNNEVLSFKDIIIDAAFMHRENFGFNYTEHGLLTVSWNTVEPVKTNGEKLFSLVFNTKSKQRLSNVLRLTDRITKSEAYDDKMQLLDVQLSFRNGNETASAKKYTLHQNIPNPFNDQTVIYFELPGDSRASISFFDLTGKLIKIIQGDFNKGMNAVEISKGDLGSSDVIYYKLETGTFTQTKKMICIN